MAALCGKMECVDQLLSDLTRDLPGWLGVVFVIVIVGAGWFGISKLYAAAGRRAERTRAIRLQRAHAASLRPGYAVSSDAIVADPDAFALAASAWLAHAGAQPLDAFAYRDTAHLRDDVLPQHYGVHDRSSLLAEIVDLLAAGHRAHPHGDDDGPIDFVAWDLVRVIELSRAAAGLGALDDDDARDTARFAARALQSRYSGWEEMGAQLARAYRHTHEPNSDHAVKLAQIECDGIRTMLTSPDGPWARVPWTTRTHAGSLRVLDGSSAQWSGAAPIEPWERPIAAKLSSPEQV